MIRRWYGAKAFIVNGEFVMLKTVNMSAICGYEWYYLLNKVLISENN